MRWRVATNEWNLKNPPWTGAVCIEECDEVQAVPGIVCWTTRGGDEEANAKLIAAAPDLLEACQAALSSAQAIDPEQTAAYALCRAAIAKATPHEST